MIESTTSGRTIARLAVHCGMLTADERAALSREATSAGREFGEHCVGVGRITAAQLETLRSRAAELDRKSGRLHLGGIAVELGYVSPDKLDRALRRQRKLAKRDQIDARLGELLLVRGELSLGQLEKVLSVQGTRRLRCPSCEKALEINRLGKKQPRCPGCGAGIPTPTVPPRAETIARAERLRRAMIDTFDRARIVRDASDVTDVELTDDELHDSAGVELIPPPSLDTIDLDVALRGEEDQGGDALGAARDAFRTFHQTRRIARPEEAEAETEIVRPSVARAAVSPVPAAREGTRRHSASRCSSAERVVQPLVSPVTRRRLVIAACLLTALAVAGGVVFYLECERDRQLHREAIAAAAMPPKASVANPMAGFADGSRVCVYGVIRGGEGGLDPARCGARLVVRGFGELWVAEPSAGCRELFAVLADRHAHQQRTALRITGTIRRGGAGDGSSGPWVQVDPGKIEIVRYAECADREVGLVRLEPSSPSE